ncbi:hypothetical protein KR074_005382 [Drosophila pseudoananassae]|nr:hypothetical protein KR074_005382 [Drosophila pseudoananassae]
MVNELNRPQTGDNAALSERLAASNRQLQEMQQEHRQLLLEMETLRTRAAELTRLNAQRHQVREATSEAAPLQEPVATQEEAPTQPDSTSAPHPDPVPSESPEPNQAEETSTTEEDKQETASYLQEKLNEIANLKAQFKRVQHMVDTTKLIEQHISTRETSQSSSSSHSSRQTTTSEVRVPAQSEESASSESQGPNASVSAPPDNAELLNAMLNMFTDFTSDLRGQAESLRAERDRIKTLKEEIIQRKQGK